MRPHYIIDGYNLIHKVPGLRSSLNSGLEHARNVLIFFIRGYLSSHNVSMTLVFDGDQVGYVEATPQFGKRLRVIYSRPPQKADPIIKELIRKANNKKSLVLVSADNELIRFCRQQGGQVLAPLEFYHRASKHPNQNEMDQKYHSGLSRGEVEQWLQLFGENNS